MTVNDSPLQVKFDQAGLVPAIIQHAESGQVLMLGYMNAESLQRTMDSGLSGSTAGAVSVCGKRARLPTTSCEFVASRLIAMATRSWSRPTRRPDLPHW